MPQKTYTAKNGAKYIKMANGRTKFVSGPTKRKKTKSSSKKKGAGLAVAGSLKKSMY